MDLLKLTRSYTSETGTFFLLPYATPLLAQVMNKMREAFGDLSGPGVAAFALAIPLLIKYEPPTENPPIWADILVSFLADKSYFVDPVGRWNDLAQIAPNELYDVLFVAYTETRPRELMASEELQQPMPDPLDEDGEPNLTTESVGLA